MLSYGSGPYWAPGCISLHQLDQMTPGKVVELLSRIAFDPFYFYKAPSVAKLETMNGRDPVVAAGICDKVHDSG